MPNKEFLETYPLYRKFSSPNLPERIQGFPKVQLNMSCSICKSNQTFVKTNDISENSGGGYSLCKGITFRMVYLCTHCQEFERLFFITIGKELKWLMKVGQFPAWDTVAEPNIERLLGEHSNFYKKGIVSESQGYGIGAYAYYRRIVEEIIDGLLDAISGLLSGEEKKAYEPALARTKAITVTQEKIDLVKDLLPPILRPDGINPLSVLHSTMSKGLHGESDETCLEYAQTCREALVFLVNQVEGSKISAMSFTKRMRTLLDKK